MDPILSLALAVQANKGVYALMLGSGVSRAASIPTGWEVVEDLIRKIAHLQNEDPGNDPAEWYFKTFGQAPNYSDLLAQLARQPAERTQLLRRYFEPTEDERAQGLKTPTKAHKEIAWLVANGYTRVILTTNFDRLLESAIEAEGIVPTVISSSDAISGAMPIVHSQCCVVKVHGDYMDTRIRNTPEELAAYDSQLDNLLDRIFDEYGLLVCGWSAEWDIAMRAALARCPSRRFTTFWAAHGAPTDNAAKLIEHRRAAVITIKTADDFFHELREKVESLEQLDSPHPLSAKVAAATVKRYLVDPRHRIELHDLVTREVEKLVPQLSQARFPFQWGYSTGELAGRLRRYEALTEIIRSVIAVGCYWGNKEQSGLWTKALDRISNAHGPGAGTIDWINLRLYPALLAIYSGGVAATAASAYHNLSALVRTPTIRENNRDRPLVEKVNSPRVIDLTHMQQLLGVKYKTPVSEYLLTTLREPLREILPDETLYKKCFDRFEYFFGLLYVDATNRDWAPVGSFTWRDEFEDPETSIAGGVKREFEAAGDDWEPLRIGLFNGSSARFLEVHAAFQNVLTRARSM